MTQWQLSYILEFHLESLGLNEQNSAAPWLNHVPIAKYYYVDRFQIFSPDFVLT